MEENKKSKKGLIFIIALILGLVVGIGGSYYYFNVMNNDKGEASPAKTSSGKTIKNLEVTDKLVQDNYSKLMVWGVAKCDDSAKEYFKESKVKASDISNESVYSIVDTNFYNNKGTLTKKDYEEKIEEYFGKDYKYEHTDWTRKLCSPHRYNKSTGKYEYQEPACGCTSGPNSFLKTRIVKAELSGDELVVYVKVLFPGSPENVDGNGNVKYYSDASLKNAISDLQYTYVNNDGQEDKEMEEPSDVDKNYAKGGTYKFVMKKYKDDKYSFLYAEPLDD